MTTFNQEIYVINSDKMIYKIESVREIDGNEYGLVYTLELVAGYDYIDTDYSDKQGFVSAEGFVDDVQVDWITVYPLSESLGERLKEQDYTVININDYKIHQFKTE